MSIGSILQYANSSCTVWGSGLISETSKPKGAPKLITAVRGPMTAARLQRLGLACPNVYGDPALLTSRFLKLDYEPIDGQIGLIPHYVDWDAALEIKKQMIGSVDLIDIRTDNLLAFCKKIVRCDLIVSSSLHGLIIAESFGVPAVWCKISSDVTGGAFKFADYFRATGREGFAVSVQDLTSRTGFRATSARIPDLTRLQDDLLSVFPTEFGSG